MSQAVKITKKKMIKITTKKHQNRTEKTRILLIRKRRTNNMVKSATEMPKKSHMMMTETPS